MNIEDGNALADAELRAAFAHHYPEAWGHIQARRAFMHDVLGIQRVLGNKQQGVDLGDGPIDAPAGAHFSPMKHELLLNWTKRGHLQLFLS